MQVDFTLKSSYLDVESFHFANESCGSHAASSTHVSLRTPLDACGTTSRQSVDSVTYFNKVVAQTKDQKTVYIVEFPFSCAYNRRDTIGTPSFQPRKKITFFEGKINLDTPLFFVKASVFCLLLCNSKVRRCSLHDKAR